MSEVGAMLAAHEATSWRREGEWHDACPTTYQEFLICQTGGCARSSRTNASGGSRSGRVVGSNPSAWRSSPGTTFFSCLRRLLKHAVTNLRNRPISSGVIKGVARGVSRTTALRTFGGGLNEPGAIVNSFSTRATACTPTDNAP